ncbi:MAG: hypothetical protein QM597_05240 [Aeromicrobium sp.]|uniref:hypothetical protein n=1 Tax=Aeromicrobium sp. TaxID=1871063 RepID=UPI0039E47AE8
MTDSDEPVGSLAEETVRLVAAMMGADRSPSAPKVGEPDADGSSADEATGRHSCPHGWCPLCQVVDYVQEHPEAVAQVVTAGMEFLKVVRDAVEKATGPQQDAP